jgi:hypothetical protein
LEEKIVYEHMEYNTNNHKNMIALDRDMEKKVKDLVLEKIVKLINRSRVYMLGPEKTSTARFISKHYMDVYEILKEIIKNENREF